MSKLVLASLAAVLLVAAPPASSASTTSSSSAIVVGALYASGGNAGATYANDYVELFNRGSAAVDVSGWTVQYASAASTSWSATPLAGSIPAGGRYLVALAGGSVGAALPTPDATGTTNLAASGGKVAVVDQATPLSCGATAGSCVTAAGLQDLVGYGSAADYEGAGAAPALSATTAAVRAGGGCTDSNDNAADFATAAPSPQNAAAAASACAGATPPATPTASVAVTADVQSAISLALDRTSVGFGTIVAGTTPPPVTVTATVRSNDAAGYALTVHRTAFAPTDLPLGISRVGSALAAVPVAPAADLALVSTTAASAAAGDSWPFSLGFTAALPLLAPGRYSATVTYTVIGR